MAWDDVLAAFSGGVQGWQEERHSQTAEEIARKRLDVQQQVAEIRAMIEGLKEGGRTARAANAEDNRNYRTDQRVAAQYYGVDTRDATTRRGQDTRSADTRYGIDTRDAEYWDKAARDWDLGTGRLENQQRGQNIFAATTRRGQDLQHEDRGRAIDENADSRAMTYALGAYKNELARRRQNNSLLSDEDMPDFSTWLYETEDPEVFPSVKRQFGKPAAVPTTDQAGQDPSQGVRPTNPPRGAAPGGARPALPIPPKPRPQGATPPSAEDQARTLIGQIKAAQAAGQDTTALKRQLAALRAATLGQ